MHFWSILWIFLLKNGQATDASIFAKLVHMVLSTSWKVIAMTTWVQNHRHDTCNGELNVKNQKGKAQSRRKRLSQEIFVK